MNCDLHYLLVDRSSRGTDSSAGEATTNMIEPEDNFSSKRFFDVDYYAHLRRPPPRREH